MRDSRWQVHCLCIEDGWLLPGNEFHFADEIDN
jgi:hypothetical protein